MRLRAILFACLFVSAGAFGENLYTGDCWIDDDPQFDAGQKHVGLVMGESSLDLREECAYVARDRYGDQGSSLVSDIKPAGAVAGVEAECWIDDDKDFDLGQKLVGKVFGRRTLGLRHECAYLAKERYGENSSSGLDKVQLLTTLHTGLYSGDCWVDDDKDFDEGQKHGGLVFGFSPFELREECSDVAFDWYGENGSSGVKDIKPVSEEFKSIEAECWVDDDKDFDPGQKSGGYLVGRSTMELRSECKQIAFSMYGANSSSGLANVKLSQTSLDGFFVGHCWIDDDPQFDAGQKDAGLVYGRSSWALREECAMVAHERYGDQGSSSVIDIKATPPASSIEAECWVDDDKDFDPGQKLGGKVVGPDTLSLRKECSFIAKQMYGENSSSGLANVKLIP